MILKQIEKSYKLAQKKGYDKVYYYFDIHETILLPDYDNTTLDFYPYAKQALQLMSQRSEIVMGLYTCSYPKEIERYQQFFKENGIIFTYVNENPEAQNTGYGCYTHKPYFNVLFEDKSGFDATTEWEGIFEFFNQ